MEVVVSSTPAQDAGAYLSQALARHRESPVLLLLSGGSALALLEHVDPAVLGPHLTLTTLDERYSSDPSASNFSQIVATDFYAAAQAAGVECIDSTFMPGEILEVVGARFETALHSWHVTHPQGVVVATLGIGLDGHTAGIFPGPQPVDFAGPQWVASYSLSPGTVNRYRERITVTYTYLRSHLTEAIVYAVGPEKRKIIDTLAISAGMLERTPAAIIVELPSAVVVIGE